MIQRYSKSGTSRTIVAIRTLEAFGSDILDKWKGGGRASMRCEIIGERDCTFHWRLHQELRILLAVGSNWKLSAAYLLASSIISGRKKERL